VPRPRRTAVTVCDVAVDHPQPLTFVATEPAGSGAMRRPAERIPEKPA